MKILLKTNLKCGGCEATIKPFLDELKMVESWKVDLSHPDKLLEVELATNDTSTLLQTISKAGFTATVIE